jgi:hypothetical protein
MGSLFFNNPFNIILIIRQITVKKSTNKVVHDDGDQLRSGLFSEKEPRLFMRVKQNNIPFR